MRINHRDMLQHILKGLEKITKNSTAYRTFLWFIWVHTKEKERYQLLSSVSVVLMQLTLRKLKLNWVVLKS